MSEQEKQNDCSKGRGVCGSNTCKKCYKNSFAVRPQAIYWSSKNIRTPRQVSMSDRNQKYWFNCPCGHEVELWLHHMVSRNDEGGLVCYYCCSPPKKLCEKTDCELCFSNSAASISRIAQNWSIKNAPYTPRQYFKTTPRYRCWITCDSCGHDFNTAIWDLAKPCYAWCPYCSEHSRKVCGNDKCLECFSKSFASHKKSKYWSQNNKTKPIKVFIRNSAKYEFFCKKGHIFTLSPGEINENKWCPICNPGKNTTEKLLHIYLKKHYPDVIKEKTFDWCRNEATNHLYRFDFYIPSKNIIIELDGLQHFEHCVPHWDPPDVTLYHDVVKMSKALEFGIRVVRIYQPDVWYNRNIWKRCLIAIIESDIEAFYIGPGILYDRHKKEMESFFTTRSLEKLHELNIEDDIDG